MRSIVLAVVVLAVAAPAALAHPERKAYFPDGSVGAVPELRETAGQVLTVCKDDSADRIRQSFADQPEVMATRLQQLESCGFQHIQAAVDAASNGAIIRVMPGVYREEPSLQTPEPDPRCAGDYEEIGSSILASGVAGEGGGAKVADYEYQRKCPNAQNLIAIIGDGPDEDRVCDSKCNLQIEGMGRTREDVLISGQRTKLNVIRADRADGIYLRNFTVEFSDFNNIYVLETNGFRMENIVSRWSREYGFLSFTSDNGLYRKLTAHGSGDSGIYPGSGPEGRCKRYGIEVDRVNSYGNTIGWSGTAGNGIYTHDSKFHHNAAGITTDSFAGGHPGMPQDCSKWENNEIYSNNFDVYGDERDRYCFEKNRPIEKRNPKVVCPAFGAPVGVGLVIGGGNRNIIRNNRIWDNWRAGVMQFWVPSAFRGSDPTGQSENSGPAYEAQTDTSNGNRMQANVMSLNRAGVRDANGNDFWWDEEGSENCWTANQAGAGNAITSDPALLPDCPGSSEHLPINPAKFAALAPCATWDPQDDVLQDPPGCDWFTLPPEPR